MERLIDCGCRAAASNGDHMTIPFETLKARLLANPLPVTA